jgi:hypothetical protein
VFNVRKDQKATSIEGRLLYFSIKSPQRGYRRRQRLAKLHKALSRMMVMVIGGGRRGEQEQGAL